MKAFIPSKGRADLITTHNLLLGSPFDWRILVHNDQEAGAYLKNPTIPTNRIIVTNAPYGMISVRNWVLQNVAVGEWFLMLNDNIRKFTALAEPFYNYPSILKEQAFGKGGQFTRDTGLWRRELSGPDLFQYLVSDIVLAKALGAHVIGFSPIDNPIARTQKHRDVAFVCGKAQAIQRTNLTYDDRAGVVDDYDWTCQNLATYGRVLVNTYIAYTSPFYQRGGLGRYDERVAQRRENIAYLLKKWPTLLRPQSKGGKPPEEDLALKVHTQQQLARALAMVEVRA